MHVRRAVDGDGPSLAWVVNRLSPLLLSQARYRLGSLARHYPPDDVVHDAWLVALPHLGSLQARNQRLTPVLLRYLSTAMLHAINNFARRHARGGGAVAPSAPDLGALPSDASGVVSRVLRQERAQAVTDAIDQLDERDREVIILRGIEQLPLQTVAGLLGVTAEATSMRYSRALRRLRGQLPGSVFDELDDEPADGSSAGDEAGSPTH